MNLNKQNDVIAEARSWIGTPYLHQASVKGQGADCLGLVRGIWRSLIGPEPEAIPVYSPDWGELSGRESLLEAARKWFIPLKLEEAIAGDLLLFRWKNAAIIKHVGILAASDRFIHAYEKAGVVETTLGQAWRKRVVAACRFP